MGKLSAVMTKLSAVMVKMRLIARVNWKRLGVTVGLICGVGGLVYGYLAYQRFDSLQGDLNRYADRLPEMRKLAVESGIALTISDIVTSAHQEGLEKYKKFKTFDEYLDENTDLLDKLFYYTDLQDFATSFDKHPEALDRFYTSASIDGVSFPKVWSYGLHSGKGEYSSVDILTVYANLSAALMRERGDDEAAYRLMRASVDITNQLADEPSSGSVSLWSASVNRITRTLFKFIAEDPLDPETTSLALELIEKMSDRIRLDQFVKGDILGHIVTAQLFDEFTEDEVRAIWMGRQEDMVIPEGKRRPEAFESAAIEFWAEALDIIAEIGNDPLRQGIALDDLGGKWYEDSHASNFLGGAFVITYEQYGIQIARTVQLMRLLDVSAELLQIHLSGDGLPSVLPDFGEMATDPVALTPFLYKKTDHGFVLQAIGKVTPESAEPLVRNLAWIPKQGYGVEFSFAN